MPATISRDLLFRLRNEIPVEDLLVRTLGLPTKESEGRLRFLCPVCREFNTGIHPRENLGRCFRCERNFNPIDLAIHAQGLGFLAAVDFLLPLLPRNNTPTC